MDELAKTIAGLLEQYSGIVMTLVVAFFVFSAIMSIAAFVFFVKRCKNFDDDFKRFKRW